MRRVFRRTLATTLGVAAVFPIAMHAQEPVTISGRVQSDAGSPLIGVSISVRSLALGALTREDGRYQFTVPAARATGQKVVLEARRLGFRPDTTSVVLAAGARITHDFVLNANPLQLGEVVITGAGISTTAERIGTVRSSVDSTILTRSNETNIVNALAAKAPGVSVTSQSGSPGSSTSIRIRGLNTIQGTGQPLFIVDGTPIDNSTFATGANTGSTDSPNRASDINPDDIEGIEILKSSAAAAIYGARAGQGVILITTKSGRAGQNTYSFHSNIRMDDVNRTIPLQRSFGQGSGGVAAVCPNEDCQLTGSSWGPRLAAGTRTWDWGKDVYERGMLYDNSFNVSGGGERTTFFFSGAASNQQGITVGDNDYYNRYTARLKGTHQLTSDLQLEGNIAYVSGQGRFLQKGSNTSGVNLGLWRSPPNFNNFEYLDPTNGLHRSYRFPRPSTASATDSRIYDNPLFVINEQDNTQDVGRSFGNVGANYTFSDWLNIKYSLGIDYVGDERLETLPQSSSAYPNGQVTRGTIVQYQLDNNLTANLTRSWRDGWDSRLSLGANLNNRDNHILLTTGQNLIAPRPFNLQNTTDYTTNDARSRIRGESYFAQFQQALFDQVFLTGTIRNDGFSSFGSGQRRNWFPSATAAWTFTNAFNPAKLFSTGRLRAAYGVSGTEPSVYLTSGFFSSGFLGGSFGDALLASQGGQGGLFTSGRRPQNNLAPEKQYEFEGGVDFGVLQDRVDASLTYYNRRNTDVIFDVPLPFSSGYTVQASNGGTVRNHGWEAQLNMRPINTSTVDWDVGFQYSANRSNVTELRGTDAVDLPTGGFFAGTLVSAVTGYPMGVFRSYDFARCRYNETSNGADLDGDGVIDDVNAACHAANAPNGAVYLGADGFPIDDPTLRVVGDPNPRWTGSMRTGLRVGKVRFSGLLDVRRGGDIWNGTKGALYNFGTHKDTDARGSTVVFGETYTPGNPKNRSITTFGPGKGKEVTLDQGWFQGLGSGFGPVASQFMEDGGFVKLRELSVSYTFEGPWLRRMVGFSKLDVRVAGRNLALWTNYTGIDPETNLGGAEVAAQGIDYFNNPQTRSLVFTFNLNR
ncbi:MAG: SusC/RagA family TonB-linked outer membrane protein [Gemmatimonadaceae bacterium]